MCGYLSCCRITEIEFSQIYYICFRRNKVADAADNAWPDEIPKFKDNQKNKEKLEKLVVKLTPECSLPFFKAKGIKQHILDHFNEKRRYREKRVTESGTVSLLMALYTNYSYNYNHTI